MRAAGDGWGVHFRQPLRQLALHRRVLRVQREVRPLVRVPAQVVEFLRAVGVVDVAPVLGAHRMVVLIVRRDGGPRARGFRVLQLRREAVAFDSLARRQVAEFEQRRINVEQLHGLTAPRGRRHARPGKDERHARRAFPQRVLARDAFLAEVPAVVAPEHDDRVPAAARGIERVEHAADLRVHKARAREVGAHERPPLAHAAQHAQARLGQFPVQIPGEERRVGAVVFLHRRHHERGIRIKVEPLLRRVARDVRQPEAGGNEERFVLRRALQRRDGRARNLEVRRVLVVLGERAPVHRGMPVGAGQLGDGLRGLAHARRGTPGVELRRVVFRLDGAVVKNLTAGEGRVARACEGLGQRDTLTRHRHVANARQ